MDKRRPAPDDVAVDVRSSRNEQARDDVQPLGGPDGLDIVRDLRE
jgi:hypothetical protein